VSQTGARVAGHPHGGAQRRDDVQRLVTGGGVVQPQLPERRRVEIIRQQVGEVRVPLPAPLSVELPTRRAAGCATTRPAHQWRPSPDSRQPRSAGAPGSDLGRNPCRSPRLKIVPTPNNLAGWRELTGDSGGDQSSDTKIE